MNQSDDLKSLKNALIRIDRTSSIDEDKKEYLANAVIFDYAGSHDIHDQTVKTQMLDTLRGVAREIESIQEKIAIYNFITEQTGIDMFANGKENLQDN